MNLLVTAGNTQVLIDRVRCLTNIFTGRTGTAIALKAHERGHTVTLLTSHPEVIDPMAENPQALAARWIVHAYRTFADLHIAMERAIRHESLGAVIHCAAVSDYLAGGVFAPAAGTRFDGPTGRWESDQGPPALVDRAAGKVKSDDPELWLRITRAPKLIDFIRSDWGFRGVLVKFKLEVGLNDEQLQEVAERSRRHSAADLMVANTLEGAAHWALLGPLAGRYERVERAALAGRLLDEVERLAGSRPTRTATESQ